MNDAMMKAMELQNDPVQEMMGENPEAPIQMQTQDGEAVAMDPTALATEGLAFAYRDMAKNGPVMPRHIGRAKTMTKAQLEEQKMNEQQGYPSPIEEAEKVKELESKVANIEGGIQSILSHLSGQSSPASRPQAETTGGNQGFPAVNSIPTQAPPETLKQPSPPSTDSNEFRGHENRLHEQRQVTLSDGRKIGVPKTSNQATSLGPVSDPSPVQQQEVDDDVDGWDDEEVVQQVAEPEQPKADPNVERVQNLMQEAVSFLQANDPHKFWRRHLSRNLNRHLGYSGWPKPLQAEFDRRFQDFLNDPMFIRSLCQKAVSMEMGHALGTKQVVSFLVCTAGFTAFALCGLES